MRAIFITQRTSEQKNFYH